MSYLLRVLGDGVYLQGEDTGGAAENLIGMDSDVVQVGDAGHPTNYNGTAHTLNGNVVVTGGLSTDGETAPSSGILTGGNITAKAGSAAIATQVVSDAQTGRYYFLDTAGNIDGYISYAHSGAASNANTMQFGVGPGPGKASLNNAGNLSLVGGLATDGETAPSSGIVAGGLIRRTVTNSITAGSTQTQAGATALTSELNRLTTVGTTGDGVKLPTAEAGLVCVIRNDGANAAQIWPNTSDSIDGGSANAVDSNSLASGSVREYFAVDATNWYTR